MAEEEKESKKKSWWKWVAGAIVADQYINAKIERGVSEVGDEISKRVREELERREERKEFQKEEARYAVKEALEAREIILKDKKKLKEFPSKIKKLSQESQRLGKEIKKNPHSISNADKFIDTNLDYITTIGKLISLSNEWGINTTYLQKDLHSYLVSMYSMLFKTAITILENAFHSKENKSKISKKELKIFDDMFKEWDKILTKRDVSKQDYERFVKQVKKCDGNGKIEGFLKILERVEDMTGLRKNLQKVDKVMKLITYVNKKKMNNNLAVPI